MKSEARVIGKQEISPMKSFPWRFSNRRRGSCEIPSGTVPATTQGTQETHLCKQVDRYYFLLGLPGARCRHKRAPLKHWPDVAARTAALGETIFSGQTLTHNVQDARCVALFQLVSVHDLTPNLFRLDRSTLVLVDLRRNSVRTSWRVAVENVNRFRIFPAGLLRVVNAVRIANLLSHHMQRCAPLVSIRNIRNEQKVKNCKERCVSTTTQNRF